MWLITIKIIYPYFFLNRIKFRYFEYKIITNDWRKMFRESNRGIHIVENIYYIG